jgi:hypothetical protein
LGAGPGVAAGGVQQTWGQVEGQAERARQQWVWGVFKDSNFTLTLQTNTAWLLRLHTFCDIACKCLEGPRQANGCGEVMFYDPVIESKVAGARITLITLQQSRWCLHYIIYSLLLRPFVPVLALVVAPVAAPTVGPTPPKAKVVKAKAVHMYTQTHTQTHAHSPAYLRSPDSWAAITMKTRIG